MTRPHLKQERYHATKTSPTAIALHREDEHLVVHAEDSENMPLRVFWSTLG